MTFRIEIRVRNAPLYRAIHDKYKNVSQFCKENGFAQSVIGELLNLKISPISEMTGDWREVVMRMSEVLGFLPDELFPEHLQQRFEKTRGAIEMNEAEVMRLISDPVSVLENKETSELIDKAISSLSPREAGILKKRFWDNMTLEAVGKEEDVSPERIRQIERKIFKKLRHPNHRLEHACERD